MKKTLLLIFIITLSSCKERTRADTITNSDYELLDSIYIYVNKYSQDVKLDSLKEILPNNENAHTLYISHLEKILDRYNTLSIHIKNDSIGKSVYKEMDSIQMEIIKYRN